MSRICKRAALPACSPRALAVMLALNLGLGPGVAAAAQAGPQDALARPTQRTVTLAVPLVWRTRALGDVVVQVEPDGSVLIDSQSLQSELESGLNDAGRESLANVINGRLLVSQDDLRASGFELSFNMARLELVAISINPNYLVLESLSGTRQEDNDFAPTISPADFSAYLNTNLGLAYRGREGVLAPDILLSGAARFGGVVLEVDAGFSEFESGSYQFYRQGIRAVYDEPRNLRRWSAGDLRLLRTGLLPAPIMGGFAVEKSRRIFEPFYFPNALSGREIVVTTPSTVQVLVNGSPYRTLELQPGRYDVSDLPIDAGSNDIQFVLRDATGREQISRFELFFDPFELAAGDEEYTAAIGFLSRQDTYEPKYTGDAAALGEYRRAITNDLLLGGSVQVSQDVQVISGEVRVVPQSIPGSFYIQSAISNSDEIGFALQGGYRWLGGSSNRRSLFSLAFDYESRAYRDLSNYGPSLATRLSATASYSRVLSERTYATAGATYFKVGQSSQSNLFADVTRRISSRLNGTLGFEYGTGSTFTRNVGIRLGISVLMGGRTRVDATYQSRRDYGRISYSRSNSEYVGEVGYSVSLQRSQGDTIADGIVDYVGNRFDARLSLASQGDGFGRITDEQTARLQIGTSMAFADGAFGIGRPIQDSFLLVRGHRSLGDASVIAGRNLRGGDYEAESGSIGAGVVNRLFSYGSQEVRYDVSGAGVGYDIGSGVERVNPPYRSGYDLLVGTDRFVTAVGFLHIDGAPAHLVTGKISDLDDDGYKPDNFFTNSAGRFGVIGLAPGKSYVVQLSTGQSFIIKVPEDSTGLVRLDNVQISSDAQ